MTDETNGRRISMNIKLPLGFSLPVDIEIPDAMLTLSAMVPPMQDLTNAIVSLAIAAEEKKGNSLSCCAGCAACCNQLVPLTAPEALFLMEYIRDLPKQQQKDTIDRFNELNDTIAAAGLMEKLNSLMQNGRTPQTRSLAQDYFNMGTPCPFLKDGSCNIHEIRPIVCREYNVVSDPENCADPFNQKVSVINIGDSRLSVLDQLATNILNRPSELIPLPLIFDWYEQNHQLGKIERHANELFEELFFNIIEKKSKPSQKRKKPTTKKKKKRTR